MRKFKVILLLTCLFFVFGCKSPKTEKEPAPKPEVVETPVEQTVEPVAEEPVEREVTDELVVYFAPNTYKIDSLTAAKLNLIALEIKEQAPANIRIIGHSAKLDSTKQEEQISLKRARAVAEYFENSGLLDSVDVTFSVESKGALEPVASHDDITARNLNRRVEIKIEK